jgi:hypothetical protein
MGKHFIDPKTSEILSIFQVFPCTTQIALFWPKLLPALEETLNAYLFLLDNYIMPIELERILTFTNKIAHNLHFYHKIWNLIAN